MSLAIFRKFVIIKVEKGGKRMIIYYIVFLLAMSLITSGVYNYDLAVFYGHWEKKKRPRVPEFILMTLSATGGGFGAFIATHASRHKVGERKPHFRFVIYIALVMNLSTLVVMAILELIGG